MVERCGFLDTTVYLLPCEFYIFDMNGYFESENSLADVESHLTPQKARR
jgi:hypothetical protein